MSWTPSSTSGEVDADYSQIELHPGDGGVAALEGDVGLANGEFGELVVLTVAREYGPAHVEVQVLAAEPAPDPAWDAAVELSLRTGEGMRVTGWSGVGLVPVPVPADVGVRLRYVVIGGQATKDGAWDGTRSGPDGYLVQVWPAPEEPPRVVASTSPWSQYWTFGAEARELLVELADVPDPDRLVVVLDRALAAHPDVAEHLRRGDGRYRSGVIRYAQELFRITHASGAYADLRNDHERLGDLIDERARRVVGQR